MTRHIYTSYKDKWKKFVKKSLLNIDFMSQGVCDETIEKISYKLEIQNLKANTYLFQTGKPCKEIYIVAKGEIDIFIKGNKSTETYLDTVYPGCSIGSYSILIGEDYSISGKSKTECTLLKLTLAKLEEIRGNYEEVDYRISEYENYIEEEGLPY